MKIRNTNNRKIRVFLSSTFRDMNEERDYLVNYIFPQIADHCKGRALEFIPIDLRWGITEEESRNAAVLNSCLEEVNNSKPFFIGILGDRYGWTPGIEELDNLGLELMREQDWLLDKIADGASITEMEIDYGVLRDRNIKHAAFFIKSSDVIPSEMRENPGSIQEKKLCTLKTKIRSQKKYPVYDYSDIGSFGKMMRDTLIRMIDEEYPSSLSDAEDSVKTPHEHKLESLLANACEEPKTKEYFQTWLKDLHKLLVVVGESGVGVSSQIALFVKECRETYESDKQKILYFNFESLPSGTNPIKAFHEFMSMKSSAIDPSAWSLIAIDSIGALSHEEIESLSDWITEQTPNIHILIGVNDGSTAYDLLYFRHQCPRITFRGYNNELVEKSAVSYLKRFGKKLTQSQISRIAEEPMFRNALDLKMALDSIISHGDYETLDKKISDTIKESKIDYLYNALIKEFSDVYGKAGLINEFAQGSIAVSLSSFGISEQDIMKSLEISQARWSAVRPVILRFCKGSPDSLRLAKESWQKELLLFWSTPLRAVVGKKISDYLMSNPKSRFKNLQTIAAIYNDIWHLPFDEEASSTSPLFLEYKQSIKEFATSFETVMNVDPGLLSRMVLDYNITESSIQYDNLNGKTVAEKTQYYERLARMFSGFNKNTLSSNCYLTLADALDKEREVLHSYLYRSIGLLEKGRAQEALELLYNNGLLESGWLKRFGSNSRSKDASSTTIRLKALALEIKILSMKNDLKKLKKSLPKLMDKFQEIKTECVSKELQEYVLHAIMTAVRTLLMFKHMSDYSYNSAMEILKKYESQIRTLGLASEAAYEFSFVAAILAYYRNDYENMVYWSYYCMKSAGMLYGAHKNKVLILFNSRSYQYSRACNLYAIASWHINKEYIDWHGRGYKQNQYEALPDFRTLDGADLTKLMEVDSEVKQTADLERIWFIKAIQSIQPPAIQKKMEQEISKIETDGYLYGVNKGIKKYQTWYNRLFE